MRGHTSIEMMLALSRSVVQKTGRSQFTQVEPQKIGRITIKEVRTSHNLSAHILLKTVLASSFITLTSRDERMDKSSHMVSTASPDRLRILQLKSDQMTCCALAPYAALRTLVEATMNRNSIFAKDIEGDKNHAQ